MDVVTEWLKPTIWSELTEALRWKKQNLDGGPSPQSKKSTKFEDDDSNLRVTSSAVGVVQIIKFESCEEPVRLVISDRSTSIEVSIAAAATQKFAREERQRFTEDRVGGLIQIKAFEVVATHLARSPRRLTLLIKEFKCLGSDGSAACGMPRPIEDVDKEEHHFLDQLETIRRKKDSPTILRPAFGQVSAETITLPRTSRELLMRHRPDPLATQAEFATQVPRVLSLSPSPKSWNDRPMDSREGLSALVEPSGVHAAPDSDGLKTQEQAARAKLNSNQVPLEKRSLVSGRPPQLYDRSALINILTTKPQPQVANMPTGSEARSPKQNETDPANLQSGVKANNLIADGAKRQNGATNPTPGSGHSSETDNSASASPARFKTVSNSPPQTDEKSPHQIVSVTHASNQRISMRDVRIPKDQEAVLNRPDSWLPAHPGQRNPVANIPTGILQTFNRDADNWKQENSVSQKNVDVSISKDSDSDESSQTDSEPSSNSHYEWSPSPERESLPPDSSAPATDQSEEEVQCSMRRSLEAASPIMRHGSRASFEVNGGQPCQKTLQISLPSDTHVFSPRNRSSQSPSRLHMQDPAPRGNNSSGNSPVEGNLQHIQSQQCASDRLPAIATNKFQCSQSDSDIELVVPVALNGCTQSRIDIPASTSVTSSTSQSEPPFTQVKNTPYVHGNAPRQRQSQIPIELRETRNRAQSTSVPPSSSPARAISRSPIHVHKNSEHLGLAARKPRTLLSEGIEEKNRVGTSEIVYLSQAAHPNVKEMKSTETQCLSERASQISPDSVPSDLKASQAQPDLEREPLGPSRKRSGSRQSSPAQTKRLRTRALPPALKPSQLPDNLPDPAISARQNRRNWFAEQKSAEIGTSKEGLVSAIEEVPLPSQSTVHRPGPKSNLSTAPKISNPVEMKVSGISPSSVTSESEKVLHLPDSGPEEQGALKSDSMHRDGSVKSFKTSTNKQVPAALTGSPIEATRSITGIKEQCKEQFESHPSTYKTSKTASRNTIEVKTDSVPRGRFQEFKAAYSDYSGDFDHFGSLCRKLRELHKSKRPLHRSLWDDFVIRHRNDYRDYLFQCHQTAEDPISYEKFYHDVIEERLYVKRILKVEDICGVLESNIPVNELSTMQTNMSTPRKKTQNSAKVLQTEDPQFGRSSPTQATIDLTKDNPKRLEFPNGMNVQPLSPCSQGQKRNLPWTNRDRSALEFEQKEKVQSVHERVRQADAPTAKSTGKPIPTRSANIVSKPIPPPTDARKQVGQERPIEAVQQASKKSRELSDSHKQHLWWHDKDTPFKIFARNYAAVKSGNGNSFNKATITPRNDKILSLESRALGDLDVLDWNL